MQNLINKILGRPFWKFIYFSKSIWRKIFINKKINKFKFKKSIIYERSSSIPNCFCGIRFGVHKGLKVRKLKINKFMVGFKFGEFSFTRKPFYYPFKKKRSNMIRR